MSATEVAQIAAAVFTAAAALASWAAVRQSRLERLAAHRPELHIEVIQNYPSGSVELHIINNGGAAKKVEFLVVEGEVATGGFVPPTAILRAGESRRLKTDLRGTEAKGMAVVSGFDMAGSRFYAWAMNGDSRSLRIKGPLRRRAPLSTEDVARLFYPSFDLDQLKLVGHNLDGS